jgi:hypothetical protein
VELLLKRLAGRHPTPAERLDPTRVRACFGGSGESSRILGEFHAFLMDLGQRPLQGAPGSVGPWARRARGLALTAAILALTAALAGWKAGEAPQGSELRLGWRLPGQVVRVCRPYTEAEWAALPRHMRRKEKCESRPLAYGLRAVLDGKALPGEEIRPKGARGDRPLVVEKAWPLPGGRHRLHLSFVPLEDPSGKALRYESEFDLELVPGRAALIGLAPDRSRLVLIR